MSLYIKTETDLLEIGGKVTEEKIISALEYVPADEEKLSEHTSDAESHVSKDDRANWNNKDYNALENLPNITDDGSNNLTIADNDGNAIAKFDADGINTTAVHANKIYAGSTDVGVKLAELNESANEVSSHISDTEVHITDAERASWNNKSEFSGDFDDLENKPNITEDNSGEYVIADNTGNIIMKVDSNGISSTEADLNGIKVRETLIVHEEHANDKDIHITSDERNTWNAKATTTYVDEAVANIVNSAPEKLNTLDELAAALGDDENFATTVTNSLAEKAKQSDLEEHTTNTIVHITADERIAWNNKSEFSGDYNDLANKPNVSNDTDEKSIQVTDNAGNVICQIDGAGLTTTQLIASKLVLNGEDINQKIENHTDDTIVHITSTEREKWNNKSEFSGKYHDLTDIPSDIATHDYVSTAVNDKADEIIDSAPTDLNTLKKIATSLGDDANFANTMSTELGKRAKFTDLHNHDNKAILDEFTGSYYDLEDAPNIKTEEDDKSFHIVDQEGNIIFTADNTGLSSVNMFISGLNLKEILETYILQIDETKYQIDTTSLVV